MPIDKYFKGKGLEVYKEMISRYGPERGRRVFYATARSRGMPPGDEARKVLARPREAVK